MSGGGALHGARQVADAVLYEGYVLFPYRASALKNRYRWQWGVVIPQAQVDLGGSEPAAVHCEMRVRARAGTTIDVSARFLHLRLRQMYDADGTPVDELEVDGVPIPTWEEGIEHEITQAVTAGPPVTVTRRFELPGRQEREPHGAAGHAIRTAEPVTGTLQVDVTPDSVGDDSREVSPVDDVYVLRATVRNDTPWSQRRADRDHVLRRAIVGVHVLAQVTDGAFASAIDPPEWVATDASDLHHRGLHPVVVGDEDQVVLGAPIILYDHPQIAPESPGPSFDAAEVDELLALAVMGLSDEEKLRARATDPRAAELIDRTAALPASVQARLHGTVRPSRPADLRPAPDAGVSDEVRDLLGVGEEPLQAIDVGEHTVAVGSHVTLRPQRRADAHDLFVNGRVALVERIVRTVEGQAWLAVTVVDDPAADLHRWYGRFQYFGVDEVEPLPARETQS